ncbi:MAG: hypothetical protein AAGF30_03225 [Pseudomonadota bacterium]
MGFKNLLLAFSGDAAFPGSLAHLVRLARRHIAWMTTIMRDGPSVFERHGAGRPKAAHGGLHVVEDTSEEIRARLISMGACQHGKSSQNMFGGVAHAVPRTACVRVFMSH